MEQLASTEQYQTMIQENNVLLVQFGTHTCAPCGAIRRKIDSWCALHPRCRSVYVPLEQYQALAAGEGVFSVPTILVFIQGCLTIRESGYFSLEELFTRLQRYLTLLEEEA